MSEKHNNNCCEPHIAAEGILPSAFTANLPNGNTLNRLAESFKVFGDPTRLKIIFLLIEREMCVCDISYILEASQSAVSHQLKTLRAAKLVKTRRDGKSVFYSLDDEHISEILLTGLAHINEENGGEINENC